MKSDETRRIAISVAISKIQDLVNEAAKQGFTEVKIPGNIYCDEEVKRHFESEGYEVKQFESNDDELMTAIIRW